MPSKANIVLLANHAKSPQKEVVSCLEWLLGKARSGDIDSLVYVAGARDGLHALFGGRGECASTDILGSLLLLQNDIANLVMTRLEDVPEDGNDDA